MRPVQNNLPVCAHYASSYLPLTENWIYRIIINHKKYNPIFLTRKKLNQSLFPISTIFSLDDFSKIRQYIEIIMFRMIGYFPFLKRICFDNHVQILHVHFGYHGVKMIGLKKVLHIPMICSFYGDDAYYHPLIGNTKQKYQQLFSSADMILVLGPYMKSRLVDLGCNERKLIIHHLGIDVDKIRFEKRSVKKGDTIRFLIASSFVEKKGIDLAIKALSAHRNDFLFSIDIIGDGSLKSDLIKLVNDCQLNDRVIWHGYKPYDFLINLAYSCDVFIQASRTGADNRKEGTPMVLVDVMATGMTVISTKHSDIPEIVVDGETGYLAEENDLNTLKQSLQRIFDYPEKIGEMGYKGRMRAESEFNSKVQTAKLEEYYSQLIVNSKRSD